MPTASGISATQSSSASGSDERALVLLGLRACPAVDIRGGVAAHSDVFRAQGADNVTWLWTINANPPDTGPVAGWWPGADMSPGSASTATTIARPIRSPACSARPSARYGHSPTSRCCCPRPPGAAAGQSAKIQNLFAGMIVQDTWPGVVRHCPGRWDLPSGLAHRKQPGGQSGVPTGHPR